MKEVFFDKSVFVYITLSGILTPFLHFFEKYFFNDWEFGAFLFTMMMLDTLTGIWKHYKNNTIKANGFAAFFNKFIIYAITLILTHNLISYTEQGETNNFFSWLDNIMYALLMSREALSILENLMDINSKLLPEWVKNTLIKRLKHFDKTGTIKQEDDDKKA